MRSQRKPEQRLDATRALELIMPHYQDRTHHQESELVRAGSHPGALVSLLSVVLCMVIGYAG